MTRDARRAPYPGGGQSAAMKWVRINETWYYNGQTTSIQTTSIMTGGPAPLDHLDRGEQPFDVIPVFRVVVTPRAGIEDQVQLVLDRRGRNQAVHFKSAL